MKVADVEKIEDWQKYVAVCFDEVKVKEGIVYNKHECRVIGFVDFGEINNALSEFERSIDDGSPALAKQMLVFMVRGVFFRLKFPYAQYATRDLSADVLFQLVILLLIASLFMLYLQIKVWRVVRSLECAGFKVISLTGDKASVNRKFFRMHKPSDSDESITYRVRNPYSVEERYIYFISDVPHLIKTVRNCVQKLYH